MNSKFGLTGVSMLFFLATLAACGGGGGGEGGAAGGGGKAWGTAVAIETNVAGVYAGSPQIAIDATGNVLAVFTQWDGTRTNIMANRYSVATSTWGTAALIETDNAGDADYPQIAINANGNALAVWHQHDGTRTNIWANHYTTGTGWGTATLIETDTGRAFLPQIAIDASGNAFVVWVQHDGTRNNIWANRFIAGTGAGTNWGTAALIETDAGYAGVAQIAIDASGNALAVWSQDAGGITHIMANRYTAGTTNSWGVAGSTASFRQGAGSNVQIAIDTAGNAMTVWEQYEYDGTYNIAANRYTAATNTWGAAQVIETDTFRTRDPQIAIDANGNALAVWVHLDGVYSIAANRYTAATDTWGAAALIETDNADNADSPQIAIDANGNGLAVWQHGGSAGTTDIWANRFIAGTGAGSGWGTAARIESNNAGNAGLPQIAFDATGNAWAVWYQAVGSVSSDIWANRFQ